MNSVEPSRALVVTLGLLLSSGPPGCLPTGYVTPAADLDGDGFFAGVGPEWDCHDDSADAFPGHPERCTDGLDNDCDGRPDGARLPLLDPFDDGRLDEDWTWMLGAPDQLVAVAGGFTVDGTPIVIARDVDAQCWDSYRVTVGWSFEDDASFALELVVMAGGAWSAGQPRPQDGYVIRWERDGGAWPGFGTETTLHRRRDGEEVLLNRATWESPLENYRFVPAISISVRSLDEEGVTQVTVHTGKEQSMARLMVTQDWSEDRLLTGGVAVGVHHHDGELTMTGAYIEAN